jgi:hypothetical protein
MAWFPLRFPPGSLHTGRESSARRHSLALTGCGPISPPRQAGFWWFSGPPAWSIRHSPAGSARRHGKAAARTSNRGRARAVKAAELRQR